MEAKTTSYIYTLRNLFIKRRINSGKGVLILPLIYYFRKLYKYVNIHILFFIYSKIDVYSSFLLNTHIFRIFIVLALSSFSLNIHAHSNKHGVILSRVSTDKQAKEGYSLSGQLETLRKLAEEREIDIIEEFVGEGERGRDFSRNSIWKILDLAYEGKIDYVLAADVDRIGRDTIWMLIFSGLLFKAGVTIITPEENYELDDFPKLLSMVFDSYRAEEESKKIGKRTLDGKITKFKQKKWVKANVSFGYAKDGEWIKKNGKNQVIEDIFSCYLNSRNLSGTARKVKRKHGLNFSSQQIKNILTNPIYCGKPKYAGTEVEDASLAYISPEQFEEVQKIIGSQNSWKSSTHDNSLQTCKRVIEALGLSNTSKLIPELRYCCQRCGTPMVDNGNDNKKQLPLFKCPECDYQTKDPLWRNRDKLRNVIYFICECGDLENIEVERISESEWSYQCLNCGAKYITNAPPTLMPGSSRQEERL